VRLCLCVLTISLAQTFVVTDRPEAAFVVTDNGVATKKPVVILYSAQWCVPCRVARSELERADLPFRIEIKDVTNGGQPAYVDGIPYFEWRSPSGHWFAKWESVADLVGRWKASQKAKSRGPP